MLRSPPADGRPTVAGAIVKVHGAGASETLRAYLELGIPRSKLLNESLRTGDFERAIIEWRSLLRHIVWAPDCDWLRWTELKLAASAALDRTESERLSTQVNVTGPRGALLK